MGEQRPMFRFRLPWMHSSAPAPSTPVATQTPPRNEAPSTTSQPQTSTEPNVKPSVPAQRPFRLTRVTLAQPPPPAEPTIKIQSLSESITITSAPTIPPQVPPLWSPEISAAPETKSQFQNSYQPASPSRTPSLINSQLPSPSLTSPNFSATSQLPSPSLTSSQFSASSHLPSPQISANSQPPSPWQIPPQEQNTSQLPSPKSTPQPSSPWRTSTQARDASQPSLTDHPHFEKLSQAETFRRPQSPSQLKFHSSDQKSLMSSSPSLTATNAQPTRTETRLPSPSKTLTGIESPQPSASSNEPLSPVSIKPNVALSQPQSLEDHSKTEITPSVTSNSTIKASMQHTGSAAKPPELSGTLATNAPPTGIAKEIPPHKFRSDDTLKAHEEPKQKTMAVHLIESSGSRNKGKPKVAFQAEQVQLMNQDMVWGKEEATTSNHCSLDEKQIKSMQPTDYKSNVSESRKKLKSSNGDRVSFQKEIRNDISKLADKMAIAHPENFKDGKLSVVALVGKNKGASMQLGFDLVRRGEEFSRANTSEAVEGAKANAENISAKRRRSNDEITKEDQMTKGLINNNVQDINNSILMNSFITERNPGVHLALCYNPTEAVMSCDKKGSPKARKGNSTLPLPEILPTSLPPEGDP